MVEVRPNLVRGLDPQQSGHLWILSVMGNRFMHMNILRFAPVGVKYRKQLMIWQCNQHSPSLFNGECMLRIMISSILLPKQCREDIWSETARYHRG